MFDSYMIDYAYQKNQLGNSPQTYQVYLPYHQSHQNYKYNYHHLRSLTVIMNTMPSLGLQWRQICYHFLLCIINNYDIIPLEHTWFIYLFKFYHFLVYDPKLHIYLYMHADIMNDHKALVHVPKLFPLKLKWLLILPLP